MARIHSMTIEAPITKVRSCWPVSTEQDAVTAPSRPWSPCSGERTGGGTAGWSGLALSTRQLIWLPSRCVKAVTLVSFLATL